MVSIVNSFQASDKKSNISSFQDGSTEIKYFDLCIFILKFANFRTFHFTSFEVPALFSGKLYSTHADYKRQNGTVHQKS